MGLTSTPNLHTLKDVLITPIQLVEEPLAIDETIASGAVDYTADLRQTGPMTVR